MTILQAESLNIMRSGKQVLNGISFQVAAGEVYALLGGNGAGKSTTLLSFLGFLSPTSGSVSVNNQNVYKDVASARRAMAYLPESASLYEHLNAYENIDYFMQLAGRAVNRADIETALERVSLAQGARQNKLRGYSKGMRQKVAIALAILRDSSILLLDEPTSGLDPSAIDEFHQLVRDLADSGKAVLMVTHDVYGACQVADKIGLLHSGLLVGEFVADHARIDTETVHKAFASTVDHASSVRSEMSEQG
ncbi:ABC transporter ATP-binding protein [Saccharophagus degradans]|uniref:ABC transporter ATP-binding protein n=1 Tax=Saccharophagus degradans TaxID=86304 RepID=A0AAW7XAF8_9GAMM|nr:ABC transporter ATP-binding protein [Saccharophagus degradans]MDO6423581.1 ABC transporter ATP-binding protein [Saccharophagus degradans]MDO6607747.1 ABC transporter ATP-binding protein [Saccharophagus degradans]